MARNYYEVLGVSKSASQDDIKRAYRKLSKELHPDKHKGDKAAEEKFKEVNKAYEALGDPQKRSMYDQFGETGTRGGSGGFGGFEGFGGGQGFGGFESFFTGFDMDDLFGQFGGGQARRQQQRRGRPNEVTISVNVPLEEIGKGDFERDVSLDLMVTCSECKGERHAKGSKMVTCKMCDGKGTVAKTTRIPLMGSFQMRSPCGACKGLGKIPEKPCPKCKGDGEMQVRKTLRVKIPKDIRVEELLDGQENPLTGSVDMQFRVRIPEEES